MHVFCTIKKNLLLVHIFLFVDQMLEHVQLKLGQHWTHKRAGHYSIA